MTELGIGDVTTIKAEKKDICLVQYVDVSNKKIEIF